MSLQMYIFLVGFATILCIASFLFVIFQIDPQQATALGFLLFYMSFFCSLLGILSLSGLGLRFWFIRDEPIFKKVIISFRQSILMASVFTLAIFLQSMGMLSFLNIILLIAGFLCIELFLSKA